MKKGRARRVLSKAICAGRKVESKAHMYVIISIQEKEMPYLLVAVRVRF